MRGLPGCCLKKLPWHGSSVSIASFKRSRVGATQLTWVRIPAEAQGARKKIVENKIIILAAPSVVNISRKQERGFGGKILKSLAGSALLGNWLLTNQCEAYDVIV